jgi:putative intracellular protease/amidase
MRKTFAIFVICLITQSTGCSPVSESRGKVLMVIRDGSRLEFMITNEVDVMLKMLKQARLEVIVASQTGQTIRAGAATLVPNMTFDDVKIADYQGVILPCMARRYATAEGMQLVKQAATANIPIAAADGAVAVLAECGLLEGRQFTTDDYIAITIHTGIYKGFGVVKDGLIMTGGTCPNDPPSENRKDSTQELTKLFIKTIRQK